MKKLLLNPRSIITSLVIVNLFFVSTVHGQTTRIWQPTTGGAWTTAANWDTGLPVAGDIVIINSNQSAPITAVPTISLHTLTISGNCTLSGSGNPSLITSTSDFTVASGITLILGNGTDGSRTNLTLSAPAIGIINGTVTLNSGPTNEVFTNSGDLTMAPAGLINDITDQASFILSASGTLRIGSVDGITQVGSATGNIQVTGVRTYTAGADYEYNGTANQQTGNGLTANTPDNLTINNTAGVTLSATTTISGMLTMAAGTLNLANTNLSVGELTGSSDMTNASGTPGARTLSVTGALTPAPYSGIINDGTATSVSLIKSGSGTLTLLGLNTYTGSTTINAGTLSITTIENVGGGSSSLGAPTTALNGTIALTSASSVLMYTGAGHSSNRIISTSTDGPTIDASGIGTLTLTGGITSGGGNDDLILTGSNTGEILTGAIATGSGTLTKNGAGTWLFNAANSYTGTTNINSGVLEYGINNAISSGAINVNGGLLNINSFNDNVGAVTLGGGSITGTTGILTGTSYTVQNGTISAILGGAGIGLTKTTSGIVALSGASTYTGVTSINAGVLSVETINNGGVAGNIGAASNAATNLVLNGGTLQYTGATASTDRNFILSAGITSVIEITTGGNILTMSGASTNATGALTKTGTGILRLSGANLYTGLTSVNEGTLQYGANNAISTGAVTVNDAAVYDLNGFSDAIGALTVNSGVTGGSVTTGAGTLTLGGNVTSTGGSINASISGHLALGATRTFTVTNVADGLTVSAIVSGVTFGVTKSGNGILTFSGVNTYTGITTLNAGILSVGTIGNGGVAGNLGAASNAAANFVLSGGTLQYTGATASTDRNFTLTGATTSTFDISTIGTELTMSGASTSTSGNIVKAGEGSLILSGASQYTGTTTISAGALIAGAAAAVSTDGPFGNTASSIILGNAATTTNNSSPSLLTGGNFTIARTITISGQATAGTYSIGGFTDNNSTFSGLISFSQPFSVTQVNTSGANRLLVSGGITGGGGGNKTVTFDNAGSTTVSTNAISNGTGTTLVNKINNGTLTMNVANTYTGGTTLNGVIRLSNIAGLGASGQSLAFNGGALVLATNSSVNAYNTTIGSNVIIFSDRATVGGGITHTLGTLSIGNSTLFSFIGNNVDDGVAGITFGATTLTASTAVIDVSNGGLNVTLGALSGNFALSKDGGGQLTLNAASGRTGGLVTLSSGTLRLSNTTALGTTAVPLQLNGGNLELATDATVSAYNATVAGNVTVTSNRATNGAGINHILGTLSIAANTLVIDRGPNVTSGTGSVQFGDLTMTGAPTLLPSTGNLLMAGTATGAFKLTKSGIATMQKITTGWTLGGDFEILNGIYDATTQNTTILGNWINSGGTHTASGASTVIFNGSAAQTIGGTQLTTFNNLAIDNTSGVSVTRNETVNAALTLTNGLLTIQTGNTLLIANGNPIGGSPFNSSKHIVTQVNTGTGAKGFLRVDNLATSVPYLIPAGDAVNYLPATLTATDIAANNTFNLCAFQGITTNGEPNGTAFSASQKYTCVDAVWTVNYNGPGTPTAASVDMTVGWPASLEGPGFSTYTNPAIGIAHWDNPNWGTPAGSGDNAANIATRTGITTFSPFAVGNITYGALPIKISYFNASKGNSYNTVNWQANCSSSQAIFEVLRSYDGINFAVIKTITAGQPACNQPFTYQDNTATAGIVYYRLRVIDVDGKLSYSAIVKLGNPVKDIELTGIAPNPVQNTMQLKINTTGKDVVDLAVVSLDGKVVYRNAVQLQSGSTVVNLDIAHLPSGVYMIKGRFSNGQSNTLKFTKQ